MPNVVDAPASNAGRRGKTLDTATVKAYADAFKKLSVGDGKVVATDDTFPDKGRARKAVELVRRELVNAKAAESKKHIGTRIWPDGDGYRAGVMPRTPSADESANGDAPAPASA